MEAYASHSEVFIGDITWLQMEGAWEIDQKLGSGRLERQMASHTYLQLSSW